MTFNEFINQPRNPLDNLYNVDRKSDNKEVLRGGSYDSVISLVMEDYNLYEIYFY